MKFKFLLIFSSSIIFLLASGVNAFAQDDHDHDDHDHAELDSTEVYWEQLKIEQGISFEMSIGECGNMFVLKVHNSNSHPVSLSWNISIVHDPSTMDYHVPPFILEAGETIIGDCHDIMHQLAYPISGNMENEPNITILPNISL